MAETTANAAVNLVETRGLTRTFTTRNGLFGKPRRMTAVSDVTLDVPRARVTGVVGESGCGKSTLARLVLRLLDASNGEVRFEGVDLAQLAPASLRLLRRVFLSLLATGAVALTDDLLGSFAGGGILAKLSRRFGEGVVNGALTARVGVAAMEICRPMPFVAVPKPGVSATVSRALAGLFGAKETS